MKKKSIHRCFLCQQTLLQDKDDCFASFLSCPQPVTLPNGKILRSHFYYYGKDETTIILPYKIITERNVSYPGKSKILIFNKKAKKDSVAQFKTLIYVPALQYASPEQLLNKLKFITVLS